jgi:hypothetical protein
MFEPMPDPKEYPSIFLHQLAKWLVANLGKEKARTFARALINQIDRS